MLLSYVIDAVLNAGWCFKWLRADGGINNVRPNSHFHKWCYNGDFIILIMTTGGKKKADEIQETSFFDNTAITKFIDIGGYLCKGKHTVFMTVNHYKLDVLDNNY